MATPMKYRSIFSGQEIDEAIASMNNTFTQTDLVNDFTGGTTKIASAELAKILHEDIEEIKDPTFLNTLLQAIPNYNTYTDAEKLKLSKLNDNFKGVYANSSIRDLVLSVDYGTYVGTEFSIILDDGSALAISQISIWDTTTSGWIPLKLSHNNPETSVQIASISSYEILSFDKLNFTTFKVIVSAYNLAKTLKQVQEATLVYIAGDVYISIYGAIGNSSSLFTLSTSVTGNNVNLVVNSLITNLTVTAKPLALLT